MAGMLGVSKTTLSFRESLVRGSNLRTEFNSQLRGNTTEGNSKRRKGGRAAMDASKLILDETRLKLPRSSPGYGGQVACYSSSKKLG